MKSIGGTRRPPRLTLGEQLSRDPRFKDRQLCIQIGTPGGYTLRAQHVIGKSLPEIQDQMERLDRSGKDSDASLVDEIARSLGLVMIDPAHIITVKAGVYKDLGRPLSKENAFNPPHEVNLSRDFSLLPFTVGFLEKFSKHELVSEILKRDGNSGKKLQDMAGYFSMNELLCLLEEIINPILSRSGNVRLRLPFQAPIDVFMSVGGGKEKDMMLMTASWWSMGIAANENADIELKRGNTNSSDEYVYFNSDRQREVHRNRLRPRDNLNNIGVLLELGVPLAT